MQRKKMSAAAIRRSRVISLYKQLIYLGREYPKEPQVFCSRIHNAFNRNKDLSDEREINAQIAKAEYIVKELEALYKLKKYRAMKHRYYNQDKE